MMHYAQVILEAKSLGCDDENAKELARKVVTAAAILAVMPEDVLQVWRDRDKRENQDDAVVQTMSRLGARVPEPVA
ncbi:MAG: hypothetical protein Q4D98_04560 [Planctomycetia bacterium]|nr:hypothetical protein [Planctomycetia bacterium]